MRIPRVVRVASVGAALATFTLAGMAGASHPGGYSLFGDAQYVTPGNASDRAVEVSSDVLDVDGYGGIDYVIPEGTTFADLTELSTDFMPEADDTCLGGSPRFAIGLDTDGDGTADGYIFSYFGVDSGGLACVPGIWQNTGDQLELNRLLDTTGVGGTFYDPYANALATYGSYTVVDLFIVMDGSWAQLDSEQTFQIDNTNVDGHLYTYEVPQPETSADCKNGGWESLADDEGNSFKNQGDCVSYLNSGKN